ncbi:MAG: DUF1508 domain-containing protein [Clostridia bacterium]|nr:DUF1508 domain-containing protein [Clostridia bacterium]
MGRFIISRTAAGDIFTLQTSNGRTLAVSKPYATLDACKKAICSLVYYAPVVPVVDTSAGEYGPNPKFELFEGDEGLMYAMKSANGKSVLIQGPFATRKAALRSMSMLRQGVQGAEIVLAAPETLKRLTVKNLIKDK